MISINQIPLTRYAATVAKAFGVESPEKADPPIGWVCDALEDLCKAGFDRLFIHNPDAVGMWLYQAYPDAFEPVLRNTQLTIPFQTVMPSVTPVCFASMYTGVAPAVHGIQKGHRRTFETDSLFDALHRAGKRTAIISVPIASMSRLWADRPVDIFNCESEDAVVEKALELIVKDEYDVLVVYTYMFDRHDHDYGPDAKETIAALYRQTAVFDHMVSTIRRNWKEHNTLISFSPDHGVHACPPGGSRLGDHGTDNPLDLNILHYMGIITPQKKPKLLLETRASKEPHFTIKSKELRL